MSRHDLKLLLDDVPDTLEIVLRGPRHEAGWSLDAEAWRDAREGAAGGVAARRPSSLRWVNTSRPGPTCRRQARANASARSFWRPRSAGTGCRRSANGA